MQTSALLEQVRIAFQYLVDEYGFAVVKEERFAHFANAEVVLQSTACLIRVGRDKDEIYVDVSLAAAPETRWPLPVIVEFMTGKMPCDWYAECPTHGDADSADKWQIAKLAEVLRTHILSICELSERGSYEQIASSLCRILKRSP